MKKDHQFLKIAGVKNINEFYKRFPTEESFFKAFPEALKSAQMGITIPGIVDGMGMGMPGIDSTNYDGFNEQLIPFTNPNSNQAIFNKLNSIEDGTRMDSLCDDFLEDITVSDRLNEIVEMAAELKRLKNDLIASEES